MDEPRKSLRDVLSLVLRDFGLSELEFRQKTKRKYIVAARREFCRMARQLTEASFRDIAIYMGRYDSSGVMYLIRGRDGKDKHAAVDNVAVQVQGK